MRFCPLFSGSSGNCIFIEGGGVRVLVDAGLAGRTIINALAGINVSADSRAEVRRKRHFADQRGFCHA